MRSASPVPSLLVFLLAASLASTSSAQERPIVAVFDIEVRGTKLDRDMVDRLTDYLSSLLANKGYQVVPRSQLKERLSAQKKDSYKQCFDESCQIEIGKELAAQKTLASQVLKLGKKCKVTVNLFDLKKSASEGAGTASGDCDEDGVVTSLEKAVKDLFGGGPTVAPVAGAATGGPKAPDLSEYERLAAQAQAEEGKRLEAEKQAKAEREQYLASLEKAWKAVRKVAGTKGMTHQARAGVVRKFLQDFPRDNPHEGQAREWVASLDQGREPSGLAPVNREGMVRVPAGALMMGCSQNDGRCHKDEKPAHEVQVGAFWLDRTEVTVAAYRKCVQAGACEQPHFDDGTCLVPYTINLKQYKKPLPDEFRGDNHPVVCVDWNQAQAYCQWAGKRLPTEAEWERAARGGTTGRYYGELDRIAWYNMNAEGATRLVGKKEANAFGLFDMLGNAWEWCADWYNEEYYEESPARDPGGPATGKERVVRGGSWFSDESSVRVSKRLGSGTGYREDSYGFRCAGSPTADEEKQASSAALEWVLSRPAGIEFSKSEITVAQYRACVEAGKCSAPKDKSVDRYCNWGYADRDAHPVNCVDWNQATTFCEWGGGRLPTVQEWDAEASAAGKRQYPWGDQEVSCERAIWSRGGRGCGRDSTWPVCSKSPGNSASGLCDMGGNVWEWTASAEGSTRWLRGGSWFDDDPANLRVAPRYRNPLTDRHTHIGFRCGRSPR